MSSAELLGREAELLVVERLLSQPPGGPGMLVLEGAAGIGKTSLWLRGLDLALVHGFSILSCRPSPAEAPLAFSALGDVLGEVSEELFARLPAPQRSALEISLLLRDSKDVAPDQRAISFATLNLLRIASEATPLLIAIDDVQWLDGSSGRVLAFALRRIDQGRCRVLLTRRLEEDGSSGFLFEREFAPRFAETLVRRTIGPLSLGAIQSLIRERHSVRPPRRVVESIYEASGGNPFYALELARAQIESEALEPGRPLLVPRSLRALVQERLTALPATTQDALLTASALFDPTEELVRKLSGQGLDVAVDNGVVEIEGERIRFSNSLLASVVYAQALPERRHALHRQLAGIVPGTEERARHLALGTDAPDTDVAAELERAAERAGSRGAPGAAAELYEHSARLTPERDLENSYRRRVASVSNYFEAGDLERARALAKKMLDEPVEGPWRTDVLVLFSDMVEDQSMAVDLCRQAIAAAGSDERRLAMAYLALGRVHAIRGDFQGQMDAQQKALEHAEHASSPALLVEALQGVGNVTVRAGRPIDEKIMQRAIEIDGECGGLTAFHRPSFWYGMQLQWLDEIERSQPLLSAELERATEEGDVIGRLQILAPLIEGEVRRGNWDLAAQLAAEGLEQALDVGHDYVVYALEFQRVQLLVLRGRVEEARRDLARLTARAERAASRIETLTLLSLSGLLELSLGDVRAAWRSLEPALRLQDEFGSSSTTSFPLFIVRPNAIEALIGLDELDRAESLLAAYESDVERTRRPNALVGSARSRGILSAASGDLEGAKAALERALEAHEKLPDPFELARTLLVLGTVERRAKRKRDARAALEKAAEIFSGLGARLWVEKTTTELERVSGRRDTGSLLTPTELQVAELVASGRSNREVAAQLFLSVRTVEANLSNIYRKLDIESRSELAAKLQELDSA